MNFTLLNTRPAQQAEGLNAEVLQIGGQVLNCPTLEIVARANALAEISSRLKSNVIDKVIFISVNAVQQFAQQNQAVKLSGISHTTEFFAIGGATAKMGEQKGYPITTLSSSQFDSESFLASEIMHHVKDETILLVKGMAGRNLLENTLLDRGANVVTAELYERRPKPFCKSIWLEFINKTNPVLLVTSLTSWQVLVDELLLLAEELNNKDFGSEGSSSSGKSTALTMIENQVLPINMLTVVMSQRIASHIQQQAWPGVVKAVETQSNKGIVDTIQYHIFNHDG